MDFFYGGVTSPSLCYVFIPIPPASPAASPEAQQAAKRAGAERQAAPTGELI
jgi:hypothetical protein